MSLAARNRIRGVTLHVYRPTFSSDAAGRRIVTAWGDRGTQRLRVEGLTAELQERVFGIKDVQLSRIRAALDADVEPEDRILVESGPLTGRRFTVLAENRYDSSRRSAHREFALESTTEVFP